MPKIGDSFYLGNVYCTILEIQVSTRLIVCNTITGKLIKITFDDYSQINYFRQRNKVPAQPINKGAAVHWWWIDEEFETPKKSIKDMTIQEYLDCYSNFYLLPLIVQEILEAQARGVDTSDIWLDKKMVNLNKPTLIRIGEDIPLGLFYKIASIKWASKLYNPKIAIRKDSFFLFVYNELTNSHFDLYEWPTLQATPLVPKTDLYLYINGREVDVEEVILNAWGFTIVKKFTTGNALDILDKRLTLFNAQPTVTNTVLIIQIMEAIITDKAKAGLLDSFLAGAGEKTLDRFEKLKNLALGTPEFAERKLAITRCHQSFKKLIGE